MYYIYYVIGKACAVNNQQYVDIEEDLDTQSDAHSMDLAGGQGQWGRQGKKVTPKEGTLEHIKSQHFTLLYFK